MVHHVPLHYLERVIRTAQGKHGYDVQRGHGVYEYSTAFFEELARLASYELLAVNITMSESNLGVFGCVGAVLRKHVSAEFPSRAEFDRDLMPLIRHISSGGQGVQVT